MAVEEHFNLLTARPGDPERTDVVALVKAMGYDAAWSSLVGARLAEVSEQRLASDGRQRRGRQRALAHDAGRAGHRDAADAAAAARDVNDFLAQAR